MDTKAETQDAVSQECGLFTLPPELRNYIYTLVLTVTPDKDGNLELTLPPGRRQHRLDEVLNRIIIWKPKFPDRITVLSLLGTCRQIHDEAAGIFYVSNNLRLTCGFASNELKQFLTRVKNPRRIAGVQTLTMFCESAENITAVLRLIHRLPRLKSLRMEIVSHYSSPTVDLRTLRRDRKLILKQATKVHTLTSVDCVVRDIGYRRNSPQKDIDSLLEELASLDKELKGVLVRCPTEDETSKGDEGH